MKTVLLNQYEGLTLRSPYGQDDDDLIDAEKKKKKDNYEYLVEVKRKR